MKIWSINLQLVNIPTLLKQVIITITITCHWFLSHFNAYDSKNSSISFRASFVVLSSNIPSKE